MVALDVPTDLTLPQPGSRTARTILSAELRRCLGDLTALPASDASPEAAQAYRDLLGLVASLRKSDPGALASVVRRPSVSVWIRCLRREAAARLDRSRALAALVATVGTELAMMNVLPRPLRVSTFPERVVSLFERGVLDIDPTTTALVFSNEGVQAETPAGVRSLSLRRIDENGNPLFSEITPGFLLALVDDNPLAQVEAHPDKHGNAVDLGGAPLSSWVGGLRDAMDLIGTFLPDLRAEMDLVLHQIVPVGFDAERHLSASYQESIGTVYASLHPHPLTMAEALIHEFSHNKLNALFELDDVLVNAFHPLYRSPVRPDPRPLHGVLLAVHAFLPVAKLYERMRAADHPLAQSPDFVRRWGKIIQGNHEGAEVLLAHAQPTPRGKGLLAEIAALDQHFHILAP